MSLKNRKKQILYLFNKVVCEREKKNVRVGEKAEREEERTTGEREMEQIPLPSLTQTQVTRFPSLGPSVCVHSSFSDSSHTYRIYALTHNSLESVNIIYPTTLGAAI